MATTTILLLFLIAKTWSFNMDTQLDMWCEEPLLTVDLQTINLTSNFHEEILKHRCAISLRNIPYKTWTTSLSQKIFGDGLNSKLRILKISDGVEMDQNFFTSQTKLKFLDLSGNNLNYLQLPPLVPLTHKNILTFLYALDLSKNKFTNISFMNTSFSFLKELDLSENKLTEVPLNTLHYFSNLQKLILRNNNISKFQSSIEYSSVEYLDLSNNHLADLLGCEKFENLNVLVASNNNLETITLKTFGDGIWSLQDLYLDHNSISEISESAFEYFPNIKTLRLNNNRISDLKIGTFRALKILESLDLSNNNIGHLDVNLLSSQKKLMVLYLRRNFIETFNYSGLIQFSPFLKEIDILRNPIQCYFFEKMISFFTEMGIFVPNTEVCIPNVYNEACCKIEATTIIPSLNSDNGFAMKIFKEKEDPLYLTLNETLYSMSKFFLIIETKSEAFLRLVFYQFVFIVSMALLIFVVYVYRNCGAKRKMNEKKAELKKMIQSI